MTLIIICYVDPCIRHGDHNYYCTLMRYQSILQNDDESPDDYIYSSAFKNLIGRLKVPDTDHRVA